MYLDVDFIFSELCKLQPQAVVQYVDTVVLNLDVSDAALGAIELTGNCVICFVKLGQAQITCHNIN